MLALTLPAAPPTGAVPAEQTADRYVPGEVLVKFTPGTPAQAVAEARRQQGAQLRRTIPVIDVQVLEVAVGREQAVAAALARNPNVEFAEVHGIYDAIGTSYTGAPNDALFAQQWRYNNTGQTGGRVDADIDAVEAWTVTVGDPSIAIAILDTGIAPNHPDLPQGTKVTRNVNYTGSANVNDRTQGTDDRYGHGTHVAGSAAAATNNATGVAGTCPACSLSNVKVLDDNGSGAWEWIANGVLYSAGRLGESQGKAHVINMSLGGQRGSSTLQAAVNTAWNQGVVVVAAAGNNGNSAQLYPAAYTNFIAVAATDHNDARASFSNYGSRWVDVAAPGVNILSTKPSTQTAIWGTDSQLYAALNGTSMATPHVAGIAGLVWSTGKSGMATPRTPACAAGSRTTPT